MAKKGVIHSKPNEDSFRVELAQWLDAGLSKEGKTNLGAGKALQTRKRPVSRSEISKMRVGTRRILADQLFALAKYIGEPVPTPRDYKIPVANAVRIIGEAGLPIWYDSDPEPSTEEALPPLPHHQFEKLPHFATKLVGRAMNLAIPEGAYAVYVPYFEARSTLTAGDLAFIKMGIDGRSMHKRLIRQINRVGNHFELRALSSEKKLADERLALSADLRHLEDTDNVIEVIGLVVWQCGPFKP